MSPDITTPQDGPVSPPFTRSNSSTTSLYFDAMPSMNSIFTRPRASQSRSSSPERPFKPTISAPIPTDTVHNLQAIFINGDSNTGDGEDDKTTLRAGGGDSAHGGGDITVLASGRPPQQLPPPVQTESEMSRYGYGNGSSYDVSSPTSVRKRSLSHSEERGEGTDEASLRSVPVLYANVIHEGEDSMVSNPSQADVSRKVSVKRSPSKLVKRRSTRSTTKGKQTENLASGSMRGNGIETRRSPSRTSQRSFRSSRGPVFDMVTAPPNATIGDAGGAFGTGAVMAAPEHEVEDELQSGFQERVTIAESALTRKQTIRIQKEECMCSLGNLIFLLLGGFSG